jgi:hypothetical protein
MPDFISFGAKFHSAGVIKQKGAEGLDSFVFLMKCIFVLFCGYYMRNVKVCQEKVARIMPENAKNGCY